MTVSVALATYNGEPFLQEQLNSLARQTSLPYEVVVCDDRSRDATVSILEGFVKAAPFSVRVYRNEENVGHGDTFLRAALLCEGDWIAFCDQDDVWADHKLERFAEVSSKHSEVLLMSHSAEQVDGALNPLPYRIPDHRTFSISGPLNNQPLGVLPGFTCCVRTDLIKEWLVAERPEDMHRPGRQQSHDQFIYHLADTYGQIARLPESLALYRRHDSTVTGTRGTGIYDRSLKAKLQAGAYAHKEGFRHMADQARQHQEFYQRILKKEGEHAWGREYGQRTRNAVDHYGQVAETFKARAALYASHATPRERAQVFARNVQQGVYTRSAVNQGLTWKAMAKDLVRVLATW